MSVEGNDLLLPGLEGECQSAFPPLPERMLTELAAVGAGVEAAEALRLIPKEAREEIHGFFMYYYAPRYSDVLATLERLAELAIGAGCNLPLGGISLAGHARCTVPGFSLYNNVAVFYVVTLRLKRPDLAPFLEHTSFSATLLLRSGWNPFVKAVEK